MTHSPQDVNVRLQTLIPLQDALSSLHFQVGEAHSTLKELLGTDEDMNKIARMAQLEDHAEIEQILEAYAARLSHIQSRVMLEQRRLQSRQVRAQFAAALHRNEALLLNLQMTIISVSLGGLAAV